MHFLVVGALGQLGTELRQHLDGAGSSATCIDRDECDITSPEEVNAFVSAERPDVIINCAAWTNVDGAETAPGPCRAVNVDGPRNLARAARECEAHFIHVSTDFVFCNSNDADRLETDIPQPRGVYGTTKWEGEQAVREEYDAGSTIVRTSWLFGQDGPNFVLTMLRLAAERSELRIVADQWGSPTWTGSLAPALIRIAEKHYVGTFHLSNRGKTNWADFARAIFRAAGSTCLVTDITTEEYGAPAPRPQSSYLADEAWRACGEQSLPSWKDALHAYLVERNVVVGSTPVPGRV
ncbi:MAG: dTDP-4-dehydrorhamnose reductase [Candidatus Dormibacteria bacterium]